MLRYKEWEKVVRRDWESKGIKEEPVREISLHIPVNKETLLMGVVGLEQICGQKGKVVLGKKDRMPKGLVARLRKKGMYMFQDNIKNVYKVKGGEMDQYKMSDLLKYPQIEREYRRYQGDLKVHVSFKRS